MTACGVVPVMLGCPRPDVGCASLTVGKLMPSCSSPRCGYGPIAGPMGSLTEAWDPPSVWVMVTSRRSVGCRRRRTLGR